MNIPLSLLSTLVAFSRAGSLEATARETQSTQPTVTRQLQRLQKFFKAPLFENQGRRKVLSGFGKKLVLALEPQFAQVQQSLQASLIQEGLVEDVVLTIGGRHEVLKRLFTRLETQVQLVLEPMSNQQVKENLELARLDLGVFHGDFISSSHSRKKIFVDQWVIIIPKKYARECPDFQDWMRVSQNFPFCNYQKNLGVVQKIFERAGFDSFRQDFSFPDWIALERRVQSQISWSILPSSYSKTKGDYYILPVPGAEQNVFYFYYRKSLSRTPWFLPIVKQLEQQILTSES